MSIHHNQRLQSSNKNCDMIGFFSNETTVSATDGQHNGLNDPLIYTHIDRLIVHRIYDCTFLVLLPYCCSTNIFMIHLLIHVDRCFITSANPMYYLVLFHVYLVWILILKFWYNSRGRVKTVISFLTEQFYKYTFLHLSMSFHGIISRTKQPSSL